MSEFDKQIDEAFEKWKIEAVRKVDVEIDLKNAYTAGTKQGRMNLPKCKTCEYFSLEDSYYSAPMCTSNKSVAKYIHPKFGCIFHSEIEKLRKS